MAVVSLILMLADFHYPEFPGGFCPGELHSRVKIAVQDRTVRFAGQTVVFARVRCVSLFTGKEIMGGDKDVGLLGF